MQAEIDLVLYSLVHSAVADYYEGDNNAIKIEGSMRRGFVCITSCWMRGKAGKNLMSWKSSHGIILSLTPGRGDGTINSDGSVKYYPIGVVNTDIFLIDFLGRKLAKHIPRVFGNDYEILRLNNREIINVLPLIPNSFRENDSSSRTKKTIQLSVSREKK